jgi:hypothetical protein
MILQAAARASGRGEPLLMHLSYRGGVIIIEPVHIDLECEAQFGPRVIRVAFRGPVFFVSFIVFIREVVSVISFTRCGACT